MRKSTCTPKYPLEPKLTIFFYEWVIKVQLSSLKCKMCTQNVCPKTIFEVDKKSKNSIVHLNGNRLYITALAKKLQIYVGNLTHQLSVLRFEGLCYEKILISYIIYQNSKKMHCLRKSISKYIKEKDNTVNFYRHAIGIL